MKKGLKITGIVLGILIILMLVLPFAFRGKIEGIIKSEGNKLLNAQFDFKSLDISLFRNFPNASVTLKDFWLKGIGEFENDTLVRSDEVTATINLSSLFGDSGYDISRITVKDTWVKAIVMSDGKVNWDIMKEDPDVAEQAGDEPEEASPFKVQLQKVTVKNLNIIYDDRMENMYADIRNLGLTCSGDLGSDRTTLNIEAETSALTYKMGNIPLLSNANIYARMDIDADLENSKFTLKKNEFRLNAIRAGVDGWVAFNDPAMEMDLNLITSEVGFKEILSLVPAIYSKEFASLKTDGTVILSAQAKGIMQGDTLPQFNATMDVKNAMFQYPSLPAGVDHINIHANVSNPGGKADLTEITINPFNFRMAGNPFSLTAEIKTPVSDADFKASAKGMLNLGMIKQIYPLENDMKLDGIINADLSLSGRMSYVDNEQYDRFRASGTVRLADMKLEVKDIPDVNIQRSLLTFTPQYLQLSETTVNVGKNDITADSRFENYLGFAFKGKTLKGNLNVSSNYFNLNDFMSSEPKEVETPADTVVLGLIEIPRNIDFNMDANMKQIVFGAMTLNNINGKLIIKDGKADMKNLSMNTMGGNVVMNGYYSTADINNPEMNAGFRLSNLNFAQTYKELDMVRKLAPVFENLKGGFSGNMTIRTLLDKEMSPVLASMQGDGSLSTKDLSLSDVKVIDQIADAVNKPELKNITVKDMNLDFTIRDGRLATKPFDIKWKDYLLSLSGTTGLDQTIDYSGKIKLPASAGAVAQLTTLDLKIGGSFTSPKISVDTQSMAKQAAESVKEQAIDKIGEKLGLDSTITANKDSLEKKVKEKAAEKALDFLKKKLK